MDDIEKYFLALNLGSKHFNTDKDFNEKNTGLGLGHRSSPTLSYQGGAYKNSINKNSIYGEANKTIPFHIGDMLLSPGISAGLVTGYQNFPVPYITPTLDVGKNGYNLKFRYIPEIKDVTPSVLGLQAEIPLGKMLK